MGEAFPVSENYGGLVYGNLKEQIQPVAAQRIIIVDGPDGCGKTEISRALSRELGVPYFKMAAAERLNWYNGTFLEELRYGERRQVELFRQLGMSAVIDRGYPSEWVYSKVFGRKTDERALEQFDSDYAALDAVIVMPLRKDYSRNRHDDLVPNNRLVEIHGAYVAFAKWTSCRVITLMVDELGEDIDRELAEIYRGMAGV